MTDNVDLSTLKLSELKQIAQEKGIKGVSGLRKQALIDRLAAELNGDSEPRREASKPRRATRKAQSMGKAQSEPAATIVEESEPENQSPAEESSTQDAQEENSESNTSDRHDGAHQSRSQARRARRVRQKMNHRRNRDGRDDADNNGGKSDNRRRNQNNDENDSHRNDSHGGDNRHSSDNRGSDNRDSDARQGAEDRHEGNGSEHKDKNERNDRNDRDNNRRGGRGRQRNERNDKNDHTGENEESQPMQQIAGILDIIDSSIAFVRTTGYQAGSQDVFVPQQMIRRYGMRRGDYIQGAIRAPREGANQDSNNNHNNRGRGRNNNRGRQKNNALQRVDAINMLPPENAKQRPEFSKLTPLYPNQRLRLETQPNILTTRVIDLVMPIGKGQRALIVSPPKAGKTTVLKTVANAISANNPECHLMVVLVDERPEEVTDMQRSVNGEVIASTFDRPPSEHTAVAELAIERAKRLVELGSDVVVLLDSITRLGRAYNNSSPASGRILSGGVDSNALYPPKRFLGAARNIENGGSLTIIATAMVETGSAGDTVIFEEFKGTGNAELKLDRKIAERRVFPAVDINPSGTRKDDLLLAPDEAKLVHKLRRIMSALDSQAAIDLLIKQLKKTKSNREFMRALATSAPMTAGETEEDYI
ncbi:transcription termination factor Rho [Corynebacterium glucuronolyticum]|uniref:transcription termination factor Rho n=1 Tax=Corynebacterium glucuronolyticum TaxID=39791 RepID=UPI00019C2091|nr:transcription termination factor Rho [Corynebacterium glucuronolyticum]EEI27369.1 transcription termination factor Rho [Corynebacterium glucuronolyticum ATCC 51867]QRO83486.1 transcription termination factor Rho [Corynebacterium glucuronolyticum]